jgi:hypothetical protein
MDNDNIDVKTDTMTVDELQIFDSVTGINMLRKFITINIIFLPSIFTHSLS